MACRSEGRASSSAISAVVAPPEVRRPSREFRLARVVERMMARDEPGAAPGGLSVYRRNPSHGPFVHIDARGYRARW